MLIKIVTIVLWIWLVQDSCGLLYFLLAVNLISISSHVLYTLYTLHTMQDTFFSFYLLLYHVLHSFSYCILTFYTCKRLEILQLLHRKPTSIALNLCLSLLVISQVSESYIKMLCTTLWFNKILVLLLNSLIQASHSVFVLPVSVQFCLYFPSTEIIFP